MCPADAAGCSRLSRHGECITKHDPQPSTPGRPVGNASTDARPALRGKGLALTHGECLDILARQFGASDWNVLSARLEQRHAVETRRATALKAWTFRAEHHEEYDHGPDRTPGETGPAAIIRHAPPPGASRYPERGRAFGCYVQTVASAPFHGKRLSIRADLRCEAVTHGATIWASVAGNPGHNHAFDNLKGAPQGWLFGDQPWTERRIVIEVDPASITLNFGFFLKGAGAVCAAHFAVEEIPPCSRPTAEPGKRSPWIAPAYIDFSEIAHHTAETPPAGDT